MVRLQIHVQVKPVRWVGVGGLLMGWGMNKRVKADSEQLAGRKRNSGGPAWAPGRSRRPGAGVEAPGRP